MPTPSPLTYLKFALVMIVVIGVYVLAGLGKIDASTATSGAVTAIGMLVISLGLVSAGQQTALAIQAHTRAMVSGLDSADQRRPVPTSGQRGFIPTRLLLALTTCFFVGLGLVLLSAACTKQQGAEVESVGENIATCALNTAAEDIEKGVTDEGQIATDVFNACIGPNATGDQKARVLAILEASNKLRLAKAGSK